MLSPTSPNRWGLAVDARRGLILASFIYLGAIVFWFWPLIGHLGSSVLSGPGDGTAAIRVYASTWHSGQNVLLSPHDFGIAAPQGANADAGLNVAAPLQAEFVTQAGRLIGAVAAWNVFILFAFAATAIGTFALLQSIGTSFFPSLLGGYVFAFNPWHLEKAIEGHGMLAQTWVFPLLLWALLRLHRLRTVAAALIAGGALALCFYTTAYFLLFGAVVAVVFVLVESFQSDRPAPARLWLLASGVAVALTAPFVAFATIGSDVGSVARPIQDLQRFGAAPIEYLVPSPRHPVFGHLVDRLFSPGDTRHFAEPTLFFGLTTIALALLGAVTSLRNRSSTERRFLAAFASVLVVVAFVMSLPRKVTIASVSIPAPSYVIGEFTTLWRVYARFAVVVGFGLVILSTLGAEYLRRRTGRTWPLVAIAAVTVFELAVGAPLSTWRTTPPAYVTWLTNAPAGIVAVYPMFEYTSAGVNAEAADYFRQSQHHHPLFNVYGDPYRTTLSTRAIRAAAVDVSRSPTPSILAAEGVRYVVVHDDVYKRDGLPSPALAPGLKLALRSGNVRIARVTASPVKLEPILESHAAAVAKTLGALPSLANFTGKNFAGPAPGEAQGWLRLTGPAELVVNDPNPSPDWLFTMRLGLKAPGYTGRVVLLRRGVALASARYPGRGDEVLVGPFPLRFGRQVLELRLDPVPSATQPVAVYFAPELTVRIPPSAVTGA